MPNRRGLTLVEILLVMAVMVAVAAVATPTLFRSWEMQRLRSAGEQIRVACSKAHTRAMRTGQIQVLRFELGGDQYQVMPWSAGDEEINASANIALGVAQPQMTVEPLDMQRLPEKITFLDATTEFDSRGMLITEEAMSMQISAAGVQWSPPILFYPDGTSSQAEIVVTNERDQAVQVTLRQLTGMSKVGEVTSIESLNSDTDEGSLQ